MRRPKRFKGTKATPKKLERELITKSQKLAKDPSLMLPVSIASDRRCDFGKYLKKMEKIARYHDDPDRLVALASRGDQLVRAYAATISLASAGKVPFLATTKLPDREVSYAVRGKVDKEKLIGVQYYDDPDLRLLAFWDIAHSRDIHLYSSQTSFKCSKGPAAPKEYVKDRLEELPYDLDRSGSCQHESRQKLVVRWISADISIRVCGDCLADANLVGILTSRISARDPKDDFSVEIEHEFECLSDCEKCITSGGFPITDSLLKEYMEGEIDDSTLASRYLEEKLSELRRTDKKVFIIGDRCFGQDVDAFMAKVRGNELEKEALDWIIRGQGLSVISDSDLAVRMIADLWKNHSHALLSHVSSEEIARKVADEMKGEPPASQLREARRMLQSREVEASLPKYSSLGEIGKMADSLARTYKIEGKEAMLRLIEKAGWRDHRPKAVSYAFLSAVGEGEGRAWQFTEVEKDFGSHLSSFADTLLQSDGEGYHESLKLLVEASGAIEEMERP